MELAIALTLYLSFGAFLFFGTIGAPPEFGRVAIGLCGSELIVAVVWVVEPSRTIESIAGVQIPVMTAATLVLAAAYGLHVARRW